MSYLSWWDEIYMEQLMRADQGRRAALLRTEGKAERTVVGDGVTWLKELVGWMSEVGISIHDLLQPRSSTHARLKAGPERPDKASDGEWTIEKRYYSSEPGTVEVA